jgi:hypothetical protein
MSTAELVPYERFEEYRRKLNNLRRRPAKSSVVEPHGEREGIAVSAVAVRHPAGNQKPPQDFTK